MAHRRWNPFPHPASDFDYAGAKLKKGWSRLHRGDREPFPDAAWVEEVASVAAELTPRVPAAQAASTLQDAWRAYHAGDFGPAVELGLSLGPIGFNVANKAANIYATYLETDEKARLALFQASAERGARLAKAAPALANAYYFQAQALGRYSQGISVVKALAQGLGGRILGALNDAIAREPKHADAHIALGAYHAEVIAKVGAMVGSLTYGASRDAAVENFDAALKLNPDSAIARVEYANALAMLFGKARMKQATALYRDAAACIPADAMECLDVELAKSELES